MKSADPGLHISDDWISIAFPDLNSIRGAEQILRKHSDWLEVVSGLDSMAVQFDPGLITPGEAADLLQSQLKNTAMEAAVPAEQITIPVCYDVEFGPDQPLVAEKVGIARDQIPNWHSQQQFEVTMLGFMPGFAYLMSDKSVPEIGRLAQPRSRVTRGSVGIIGDQSCLYSFASPGGWPIIGRTPLRLFDAAKKTPALVSVGRKIVFTAIDRDEFDAMESAA